VNPLKCAILVLLFTSLAYSEELNLRTSVEEKNNFLTGSFENTIFKTDQGSITGTGIRASFQHWMNESYGVEFAASVAMNNQSSVQSNSFTGFNAFGYYALWGTPYTSIKKNFMGDKLVASELRSLESCVFAGLGISQYFLNGTRGVYSASGLGAGVGYTTHFWGLNWKASAHWTQLQASDLSVNGLSYDIGFTFIL
jgi:hypothetical protein